ncbi:DNA mismatch repair protein MutL [Trichinella pseudospiralis]
MSLAVWPPLLLLCSMALTTSPPAFEITAGHQIVADDLCPGVDRSRSSSFVTLNDAFAACLLAAKGQTMKASASAGPVDI